MTRDTDGLIAHVDGASRGNPGDAAFGVWISDADGETVAGFGDFLGRQTNNHAEYRGLLAVLEWAENNDVRDLTVRSDSQLVVRQMNGGYRVKSAGLRPLWEEARTRSSRLRGFRIEHVRREDNEIADRLANLAIDRHGPVTHDDLPEEP